MRIALVHDWLNTRGGAERMLLELHDIFPEAPIYTLFANSEFLKRYLPGAKVITSPLQKVPRISKIYPFFLPLMPSLIESFDLSDFDVVISSSVSFSKGLVLKPRTYHICYCYSPTRFLWDRHIEYASEKENLWLARIAQHFIRLWDFSAADRVDKFIAISGTVKKRISKFYGRESEVIYPPISIRYSLLGGKYADRNTECLMPDAGYFLVVARLYRYKNIDVVAEAFRKMKVNLVIIGTGPEEKRLKKIATANVKFLGEVDNQRLAQYYTRAEALIIANEEDFGLTAVEAMSFGTPVIALNKGGAAEIVKEGISGELFDDPIPEALMGAITRYEENKSGYDKEKIKAGAGHFSKDVFKKKINEIIYRHRQL